ncbi:hypothetical protein [Microbacterium pygmaeum]|uniref:Uncharacterized protein n=1 Tax=Microbacterium pygmaeum TaxID=370764 RepID=A0A1G7TF52_9MICO|nr:hypothetical protein [Microbacterium pygmaeum]SDG33299.1 hypothetical protein SAMN04489810_0014 [Microbacterium pygmaeum]SDH64714.1 hypothetical protein SAMN04489810_3527 [Microbacterium pygmaeum]
MARPVESSTSLQRTYRYLRISIAATVVAIFVSVAVAAASVGWLTSVSDYFYTPARNVFVGSLIAVSLALFALSGRGLERALLDAAALFAPLIAVVPTTLAPGTIPGVGLPCQYRCFPPEFEPDAENGVITYVIVGGVAVLVALALVALQQSSFRSVAFSLGLAVAVLAAVGLTWLFARDAFLQQGHFVATVAFFALFAAVAVLNAFPRGDAAPPPQAIRAWYIAIAALLALVLVVYVALGVLGIVTRSGVPVVLLVEAAALCLFCAFWVVQCIEKWNEGDPGIR